uniref:Uncharacterized protein n=1 Tax=Arundo donax TaxID=35708 RepID=A0A0A9DQA5_ARUDO
MHMYNKQVKRSYAIQTRRLLNYSTTSNRTAVLLHVSSKSSNIKATIPAKLYYLDTTGSMIHQCKKI